MSFVIADSERSSIRVLVVDDDPDGAITMVMLLKHVGYTAQAVCQSMECLEAVQTFRPQVILLDIGMPLLSGYTLARQIRALPDSEKLTIIAVTGYADFHHVRMSFEAGCDEHLPKPVVLETLESIMRTELSKRGLLAPAS